MEAQKYATYCRDECAVFLKTSERFGGLSNMAGGYPLLINGVRVLTSEALYQACRFPHLPEVQKLIIGQASPMTAKMKSKPYRKDSRPDWDTVRVSIMRWCLHIKLVQNWEKFGDLLLSTGDRPIVEESYRDPFWGAKPTDSETLHGANILGRLLVELREQLRDPEANRLWLVEPPPLPQFLFLERQIGVIEGSKPKSQVVAIAKPLELLSPEQIKAESIITSDIKVDTEDSNQPHLQATCIDTPTTLSHIDILESVAEDQLLHQLEFEAFKEQSVPQTTKSKQPRKRKS